MFNSNKFRNIEDQLFRYKQMTEKNYCVIDKLNLNKLKEEGLMISK